MLIRGCGMGKGTHIVRARVRARIGAIMNMVMDDVSGRNGSLVNSFTASAIGWRSPCGPTTLGPLRNCIYPRTFRSIRVRNATASNTGTIVERRFVRYIMLKRGLEPLGIKV
jgi:hypothetical protein